MLIACLPLSHGGCVYRRCLAKWPIIALGIPKEKCLCRAPTACRVPGACAHLLWTADSQLRRHRSSQINAKRRPPWWQYYAHTAARPEGNAPLMAAREEAMIDPKSEVDLAAQLAECFQAGQNVNGDPALASS